ncbi:hypothetical protein EV363DRAFT_1590016 [Boletus edulis]|nr:hypothetical protein EV363DRAFT_1590016 [Boletus edulis]
MARHRCESYLSHGDAVVLALNPFFVLEYALFIFPSLVDVDTAFEGTIQPPIVDLSCLAHSPSLSLRSAFVHDLHAGSLDPDAVLGSTLDIMMAIVQDAEKFLSWRFVNGTHTIILPPLILNGVQVSRTSVGVLTTKIQKTWSRLRQALAEDRTNAACLRLIDDRLFIACLDDAASAHEGIENMYDLREGVQCDLLTHARESSVRSSFARTAQLESTLSTDVNGHTVLRFAVDVFTEGFMLLARSIDPSVPMLFRALLSPHAKSYKPPKASPGKHGHASSISSVISGLE